MGSISGASARGPRRGSRSSRSSPSSARSGRKPVAAMISSTAIVRARRRRPAAIAVGRRRSRAVWKPVTSSTGRPRPARARARRARRAPAAGRRRRRRTCGPAPRRGRPDDLASPAPLAQRGQVEQRVERRVAAADHQHAPAGVALAVGAEHVGDAVDDPVGRGALAGGRARRRRPAGSACVHVPEASITARPGRGARRRPRGRRHERRLVAARRLILSKPRGDGDHAWEAQLRGDLRQRGQRLEVALDQLVAGRVAVGVRRVPAGGFEQPLGGRVDVELPRREHAHVPPRADAAPTPSPASNTIGSMPRSTSARRRRARPGRRR